MSPAAMIVSTPSPLHEAAYVGDMQELSRLLDCPPTSLLRQQHHHHHHNPREEGAGRLVDAQTEGTGFTPLMSACVGNRLEVARHLLLRGSPCQGVNLQDWSGQTALLLCCRLGHHDLAALLLTHGADARVSTKEDGLTPLLVACMRGDAPLVRLLLLHHQHQQPAAAITATDRRGGTALMAAAGGGHVEVVRELVRDGRVDVNQPDLEGRTALLWALANRHADVARVLIVQGGADVEARDARGGTARALAARAAQQQQQGEGSKACIELLQWLEEENERVYWLAKARRLGEDGAAMSYAPIMQQQQHPARYREEEDGGGGGAKRRMTTREAARRARAEWAPIYLRERVERGQDLPTMHVWGTRTDQQQRQQQPEDTSVMMEVVASEVGTSAHTGGRGGALQQQELQRAVLRHVVSEMKDDPYSAMIGLLLPRTTQPPPQGRPPRPGGGGANDWLVASRRHCHDEPGGRCT